MTTDITKTVQAIAAACGVAFAVFFFLDDRHAHHRDLDGADADLRERILMSDSTRYAEVAKYYYEIKAERELTPAEQNRLELAERQQQRINETLKK